MDDRPRRVYADWLTEQGDPRGEFIQVQCELARVGKEDPDRRRGLRAREREILGAHYQTWTEVLEGAEPPITGEFRRGFLELLYVRAAHFGTDAMRQTFEVEPVVELRLEAAGLREEGVRTLFASPLLERIRTLSFSGMMVDGFGDAIVGCAHLHNLEPFKGVSLSDADVAGIARSPYLTSLTSR